MPEPQTPLAQTCRRPCVTNCCTATSTEFPRPADAAGKGVRRRPPARSECTRAAGLPRDRRPARPVRARGCGPRPPVCGCTVRGSTKSSAFPSRQRTTFFRELQTTPPAQPEIARPLIREIDNRLQFLEKVGVGYLTLDRPAESLSGGELQRVRLATSIGSGLVGVCYILDEPSIGLHPRDNQRLIEALRELQKLGNTVLVVEHDETMMRQADQLIDMGPGAGTEADGSSPRERRSEIRGGSRFGHRPIPGGTRIDSGAARNDDGPPRAARSCSKAHGPTTCRTSTSGFRSARWSASPASAARARARWSTKPSPRR